jgi:hypothetical protein
MIETLLIIMAITQIISLQIIGLPVSCQIMTNLGLRKNPEWIDTHPEFKSAQLLNNIIKWFMYLVAAASAAAIVYFVVLVPSPEYYLQLSMIPIVISSVGLIVFVGLLQQFVINKIPAPDKVSASLSDRRLSAFVPMWIVYAGSVILGFFLCVYGYSYVMEIIDPEIAMRRVLGLGGLIILLVGIFIYTLKRKHSEMEVIMGPIGRKMEVWGNVVVLYLGVFVGIWRIFDDFYGINLISDATFFLVVGFSIQAVTLVYSFHPKVKLLLKDQKEILGA